MLVPQYTMRRLLVGIAVCAVVALVMGQGAQGAAWAIALTLALVVLALSMLVFAGVFMAVWLLSRAISIGEPPQAVAARVVYATETAATSSGPSGAGSAPADQA